MKYESVVSKSTSASEGSTLAHKNQMYSFNFDSNTGGVDPSRKVKNIKIVEPVLELTP